MPGTRLHSLLASIARALQSEQRQAAVAAGLLPVQGAILAYLRDANRYSNTPQALAEYLALTKGTVSQSLKLLEAHGWIARNNDDTDRRVVRLTLTRAGRERIDETAVNDWRTAGEALPATERRVAEAALERLLGRWQQARGGRTFGVCRTCRHFQPGKSEHLCGLTGETLSERDSSRICREHTVSEPPKGRL
jgi:DNA-binding MarR family transcriptional regulator